MAKFRFNPDSVKRVRANMEAHTAKEKKVLALALEAWGDDTKGEIQEEIVRIGAVDQSILLGATDRTHAAIGDIIRLTVFNSAEHASVIEFGRQPKSGSPPPLLPLVGWAGRKGIIRSLPRNISFGEPWKKLWAASGAIFRNIKKGGRTKAGGEQKPLDPQIGDLLTVRFIANKIFEKGIAGRRPFGRVIDKRAQTFARDIAALVRLLR